MILKLESYTNDKGMLLQERILIDGIGQFDKFIGTAAIGIQTEMGVHMQQIEFPIKASSLSEAFSKFEESARAHVEKLKQEANKQILIAKGLPPGNPLRPGLIMP